MGSLVGNVRWDKIEVLTGIDNGKFPAIRWYLVRLIDFVHHKHRTLGLGALLWMNSFSSSLGLTVAL